METNHKYDPEDIESLLMHKQFHELYDEERDFVLQHVENEEEYESLRKTLYGLHDISDMEEMLDPDPSIRKALLKEFSPEKKNRFVIWLNSVFAMPEVTWHRRPAVRVAFACAIVLIASVVVINYSNDEMAVAENHASSNTSNEIKDFAADTNNLFAENLSGKEIPPSPKTILPPPVAPTVKFTPIETEKSSVEYAVSEDIAPVEDKEEVLDEPTVHNEINNIKTAEKKPAKSGVINNKTNESISDKENVASTKFDSVQTTSGGVSAGDNNISYNWQPTPMTQSSAISIQSIDATATYRLDDHQLLTEGGNMGFTVNMNSAAASSAKDLLAILYTAP